MAGKDDVVARRKTYDGKTVKFWGDGAMTSGMGGYVRGGRLPQSMIGIVAGEVELYDWDELPCLIKVAKRLGKRKRPVLPGTFRAEVGKKCAR
jgi:hypothetical protein